MYFFEVTAKKRFIQCAVAIFWCLLGAGPIFGFAALKPTLIIQHVYEDVCSGNENLSQVVSTVSEQTFGTEDASFVAKCTAQDLRLNMMFTVGAALTNICALVIGAVLDRAGPRVCGAIAAAFLYLCCISFIFASQLKAYFDPYLVGYSLMALGGPFAYISSFQLSNAFPEQSGLILAIITGSFDASSSVFLLYKKVFLHYPDWFSLSNFYKLYLFVPSFILLAQFTIMPRESYLNPPADLIPNPTPNQRRLSEAIAAESHYHEVNASALGDDVETPNIEEAPNEESPLIESVAVNRSSSLQSQTSSQANAFERMSSVGEAYKSAYIQEEISVAKQKPQEITSSIFGILHGFPTSYQFRTWWFFLMCAYSTIQMLRLNYFVATVNSQYVYLFGSYPRAEKLNRVFDIALPLGGIVSIPVVGAILDHFSTGIVLSLLLAFSLLVGILGIIKFSFLAGLANVLLFVCFRPFFYTAVSDYCAKVFGFETFGTLYGAIMTIAGIFNITQSYLDKLTHTTFNMNPIPVNVFLIILTVISGGALVAYVFAQAKIYRKMRASRHAA